MSTSDATNRSPTSAKFKTRPSHFVSNERTKREFVDENCQELPPIAAGQILAARYVIIRPLGRGGFSDVYVALDRELNRQVALKRLIIEGINPEHMKDEAKVLASLDHPNIVRIIDICEDPKHGFFMLMQYISGPSLRELMQQRLEIPRAVEIAIRICGALSHSHSRGIIHRDIKPTNILISNYGEPLVTDFGLAAAPIDKLNQSFLGGTPRYMSPEQIRKESRVGPGSDIFSTGIVLYEMLCGKVPFGGSTPDMIADATLKNAPTPLTELNPQIPEELERICRCALHKNVKERYGSMEAFQADLIRWAETVRYSGESSSTTGDERQLFFHSAHSSKSTEAINLGQCVVRGLQPFEEEDAALYLRLIPGSPAPSGLPESLHFWKQWLEGYESDTFSRVGVLYGPSGSGKTSFVRAGILPHLAPDVLPILVNCRPGDLHAQIVNAIAAAIEWTPQDNLVTMFLRLRQSANFRRERRKVVLLLDQFDAWTTAATAEELTAFAAALLHCDGESLQALIVIRDESWGPTIEFLHMVDCGVEHWNNARAIDLLDRHHVMKLLEAVGRDYGSLPAFPAPLAPQQSEFLDRAISQMVNKDRIVPIQLAIFVKMAKLLPWQKDTLTLAGETSGIFVHFFQDLFEGAFSPDVYHRVHEGVADILLRLRPDLDQTVRDVVVSAEELEQALVETGRQSHYHRALQILIEDLRLVVRVPGPSRKLDAMQGKRTIYYQLAHDFLVEPAGLWVNQIRKSGWRGRVKARMEELSAIWSRRREKRYLPTLIELIEMTLAIPRRRLNETQRSYLAAATRLQLSVCSIALTVGISVSSIGWIGYNQLHQSSKIREENALSRIDASLHGDIGFYQFILQTHSHESKWVERGTKQWILSDNPVIRTRAKILALQASPTNFEPLAIDLPSIEPRLSAQTISLARQCPNAIAVLQRLYAANPQVDTLKVRVAITLAYLGDTIPLSELLTFASDTSVNDLTLFEALNWKSDHHLWIELIKNNSDMATANIGVLYNAMGMLGSYNDFENPDDVPWDTISKLCDCENATIQNISRWFLKQSNRPVSNAPRATASICHLNNGPTFVRVPGGSLKLEQPLLYADNEKPARNELIIDYPFWISSSAITRRQFDAFLQDAEEFAEAHNFRPPVVSPTQTNATEPNNDQPITGYQIEYLQSYCNWLSTKTGLEPAYKLIDQPEDATEFPRFTQLDTNGFRLPTVNEFTYAFSANASVVQLRRVPLAIKNKTLPKTAREHFSSYLECRNVADDFLPNRFGIHFMEYTYFNLVTENNRLYYHVITDLVKSNRFMVIKANAIGAVNSFYIVQGNRGSQDNPSVGFDQMVTAPNRSQPAKSQ